MNLLLVSTLSASTAWSARASSPVASYGGTINAYTYDTANRLATVGDGTNVATYTYLANSPLISQIVDKQSGSARLTVTRVYDFLDRLQNLSSVPSGANTGPFWFGYAYNDLDQRVQATAADGSYWSYGYDTLGQLKSGARRWVDGTLVEGEQYGYVFDDIGNRKSTTQGGNRLGQNLRSATYTPNTLNQISSRTVPSAVDIVGTSTAANTVTVNGTAAQYRKGSYFRHELAVSNGSGPAYTAVNVTADTTKLGNILTPPATQNFSYDLDGNLTGDGVWSYIWDGENRLVEIQPLTNNAAASKRWLKFSYDWRGRRIQKTAATWDTVNAKWSLTVSNRFLYSGWNLLGELNATNNSLIRGYIWGLDLSGSLQGDGGVGGLIAVNDGVNNASHFAAYDDMGNVVGFAKASDGSVTATYEYDPFGQLIRASGSFASLNPIRFSSKYFDDDVGLSYYGYRCYNPSLGIWLNRDPIQEWGGLNLYGFVDNDPAGFIDLLGLSDDDLESDPTDSGAVTLIGAHGADDDFNGTKQRDLWFKQVPKQLAQTAGDVGFGPEDAVLAGVGAVIKECKVAKKIAAKAFDAAKKGAKKLGSYVHDFKSGKGYIGKGTEQRMRTSAKQLEKKYGDQLKGSKFSPSTPNTSEQAFKDEAQKLRDADFPNDKLYNQINSPGEKLLPPK